MIFRFTHHLLLLNSKHLNKYAHSNVYECTNERPMYDVSNSINTKNADKTRIVKVYSGWWNVQKFHSRRKKEKILLSKRAAIVYVRKCDEFKKKHTFTHQKPHESCSSNMCMREREREKMRSLWNLKFAAITH